MQDGVCRRHVLGAGGLAALLLGAMPGTALPGFPRRMLPDRCEADSGRCAGATGIAGRTLPAPRIDALLAAMTLEEKIGQLTMLTAGLTVTGPGGVPDYVPAVRAGRIGSMLNLHGRERIREIQRIAVEETRLRVPLIFGLDVLHGYRTIFPVPLAEAAAFDPALWERTARAAAVEAAADGLTLTFAPMLDVARDPRWGRIVESPGEDTWLAARFAAAKVRGFQGPDPAAADSLAATAKHLAGYGAVTAGREYAPIDLSERAFREVYLPPFRAAVAAGVAAIMPAFVALAGRPMSADADLLRGLVRAGWGFEGVIVSDYGAIAELVTMGLAQDLAEAAALALDAGVDIDMMSDAYPSGLPVALERGRVSMAQIDAAVRRVLELKQRLGLFDDPYREGGAAVSRAQRRAHRALARDAARRSIVLLSNRDGLLPLRGTARRLAVIGPLANARRDMLGPWSAAGLIGGAVTLFEGLRDAFPESGIAQACGVEIDSGDRSGIPAALDVARAADVVVLCLGEAWWMSGEGASRARPDLPGCQADLARAVLDLDRPVVVLLSSGRPLLVPWLLERAHAVVATWFLGSEAGNAVADVLSGRWNPTGRLPVSWPVEVGQVPIFYAQLPTGRPPDPASRYSSKYLDMPTEPLFPFGHGLAYTRFGLRNLHVSPGELRQGERCAVEVEVSNDGPAQGEETVLLFVHAPAAGLSRPVLELKGVAKAVLLPGERKSVRFTLTTDDLAFVGQDFTPRLVPGDYELLVGPAADRKRLLRTGLRVPA
ncbi:glycoside hydrolase family 3 N-terminal domain-containing protein [Benzoatithermus flavus]|uniref:beta-glucosidase n=1 Tax=Benzoatithermus flavus TaxID=3108223 RepID=A0ABU8XX93_9PROT